MAKNEASSPGRWIACTPTQGGALSGDPALLGQLPGVAVKDAASGATVIDTRGVYNLSVKGINNVTGTAIAAGDQIYYTVGHTPVLDVTSTGVKFGIALDPVNSGATATIRVRLGAAG